MIQYDQIDRDITPYFALSPELFRKRVQAEREANFMLYVSTNNIHLTFYRCSHINLSPTGPSSISGERADVNRCSRVFQLVEPIAQFLPSDIEVHASDHDAGSALLGEDQRLAAQQAVREGRFLDERELETFETRNATMKRIGFVSACPQDSPAWRMAMAKLDGVELPLSPEGDS